MHRLTVVLFVVFVTGCGDNRSPTASTPAAPVALPTLANLSVVGPQVLPIGSVAIYDVATTLSNGVKTPTTFGATWTIDNTAAATLTARPGWAELTGKAAGTVVVMASYQGTTATLTVDVRPAVSRPGSANLVVSYQPDPVPASLTPCPGSGAAPLSWSLAMVITETQGVGFRVLIEGFSMFDDAGNLVYIDSFTADEYYPANSTTVEHEECFFFPSGHGSGYLSTLWEGVDDKGNRLAFSSHRLRLEPRVR